MINRNNSKSPSQEVKQIKLQNLDKPESQPQLLLIINYQTTVQEVKSYILKQYDHCQDIQLFATKGQIIQNLNELVINIIKITNTRTIFYKIKNTNRNLSVNNSNSPKRYLINTNGLNKKRQNSQQKLAEQIPNNNGVNNMISPIQNSSRRSFPQQFNSQSNNLNFQQQLQSLNQSHQQLQIQNDYLQNQCQELTKEINSSKKIIQKNTLRLQNSDQDYQILKKQNENLINEIKKKDSELQKLQYVNNLLIEEIQLFKLLAEQILIEKHKLQDQILLIINQQSKLGNQKQDSQGLNLSVSNVNEKVKIDSGNDKQIVNQIDFEQINLQETLKKLVQKQNQIQSQYSQQLITLQNSLNQNWSNKCGHIFSKQQIEKIIFKALKDKQNALCEQCNQQLQQKLCLETQDLGKIYLETKQKSNLLTVKFFINLKINSHSSLLAKCKNQNCDFFCIWKQSQVQQQINYSFCEICNELSVVNPFLHNLTKQEII